MIVHTINKLSALSICERLIDENDIVILLEEGVYLSSRRIPGKVHAVDVDLAARGISAPKHADIVSYDEFVSFCVNADKVCAWF